MAKRKENKIFDAARLLLMFLVFACMIMYANAQKARARLEAYYEQAE